MELVLQGEWPKREKIVKTRLHATLQRCSQVPSLKDMCNVLIPLIQDPWKNDTLNSIFTSSQITDEEGMQCLVTYEWFLYFTFIPAFNYVQAETWEVVRIRVDTLVESKCEKHALALLKVCLRYGCNGAI